jgi:hypothetical protein
LKWASGLSRSADNFSKQSIKAERRFILWVPVSGSSPESFIDSVGIDIPCV